MVAAARRVPVRVADGVAVGNGVEVGVGAGAGQGVRQATPTSIDQQLST